MRLLWVSLALVALHATPPVRAATQPTTGIDIQPVGSSSPTFELVLEPGESAEIALQVRSSGAEAIQAVTYVADTYTLVNGGFGVRLRDEPRVDAAGWVTYAEATLDLSPGQPVLRVGRISVPVGTEPGEYLAAVVAETVASAQAGTSAPVQVSQVLRSAVAIEVTVPGLLAPSLEIGSVSHTVVGDHSQISAAIANVGNVRTHGVGRVTMRRDGAVVLDRDVAIDTVFARDETFLEVPVDHLLVGGSYSVDIWIEDQKTGVRSSAARSFELVRDAEVADGSGGSVVAETANPREPRNAPATMVVAAGLLALALLSRLTLARRGRRPWRTQGNARSARSSKVDAT